MKRSLERQIIASLIVILLALTPNSTAHSQSPDFGELDFVQFLLIWTGDYRGMVDGILGPQTEKAVQAYFVRRFGQHPQDIAEQHIQALIEDASEKIGVSGFRLRRDTKLDVTFGVPESIMRPSAIHDASRLLFRSLDQTVEMEVADLQNKYASLDVLYRKLTSIRGRTISYSTFRPDWFVLSGTDRDRQFYVRYHGQGSRIRGFSISFVPARAEELEPIIVAMSNVFRPSARASDPLIAFIDNVETELNDSPAPQPPSVPPGPVVVEGKQFLSHHEIGSALSGVVLDGIYPDGRSFSETYFKDGRIRYFDAMGSESGRWSIDGDTFCTSYGAHKRACFFVEREEANCFNFYVAMKESGGILKRSKDWIE